MHELVGKPERSARICTSMGKEAARPPAATQQPVVQGTAYPEGDGLPSTVQSEPQWPFFMITAPQAHVWPLLTSNKLMNFKKVLRDVQILGLEEAL